VTGPASVTRFAGSTISVNAFNTGSGTATCPATSVLVGGGYSSNDTTANTFDVYDNYPSTPGLGGIWTVTIGSSDFIMFTPYALCSP
jgi:hypothetical protein